ncbi:MAG: heparinase II/III-family protein [Oscillospiraceae bacterium]|nr:heparinase II/III-family protein [Oscillospiraceae bacterium]
MMGIYEEKLEELKGLYEDFEAFDGYELNRRAFDEFYRSGNRLTYENEYFARRGCLMARAVYTLIYNMGDTKLNEIINAVCDEFTWALPAHISGDTKEPEKVIDLFSAETAQALSETAHYVNLPDELHERIHTMLYERIIKPYENGKFFWESSNHNWAAVCAGCVGMVYLYEFPERFEKVKKRLLNTMDCFLSGYGEDGACLEGLGYWGYGFGYFIYFAELLRRFDGTDLLKGEKIKKIAEFQQSMFLKNDVCVSFSDGLRKGVYNVGLTLYLRKDFGNDIKIPNKKYRRDYDECCRFAGFLRSFLWLDRGLPSGGETDIGEKYFGNAQWYINKKTHFSFAAKGGNNGESHNHNDVGSFIIADEEEQLIEDFGAGEYTRGYFNDTNRYKYFCTSSKGHNLPIIDGKYQKNSSDCKARIIEAGGDNFVLDIGGAYNIGELTELRRSFKINENKITLRDDFSFSCGVHNITERLVSPIKPKEICGDTKIKDLIIKSKIKPNIKKHIIRNHAGENEAVYTIDYVFAANLFECEFIYSTAL